MTRAELITLTPMTLLAGAAVALLLLIAMRRHHTTAFGVAMAGLMSALLTLPLSARMGQRQVTVLLVFDRYALFYIGLLIIAAVAVAVLAHGYLDAREVDPEEFYLLLLLATLGGTVLVVARHFAALFLGLEVLTVSLYTLIAYPQVRHGHIEAGLKYLVLAAASAAFLLFGMALVYAEAGTMEFPRIAAARAGLDTAAHRVLLAGLGMVVVGIGFKLAVVPFHLWTPDVYEGAPAPVAGFIATVSKGAMLALLLRLSTAIDLNADAALYWGFVVIAVASMLVGNLLALLQGNVKRILAYSSIAHLGFLLVPYLAGGNLARTALTFYLVVYFAASLTAFGVVSVLSPPARDADNLADYEGLYARRPWLAGAFTAALLSLAGIPFLAGFVGKVYLVAAGAEAGLWLPVIVLIVASVVGLFYYLRIVSAMYVAAPPAAEVPALVRSRGRAGAALLAVLTLLMIGLGVYPGPLIDLIERFTTMLT